jgi:LuxR family maltose regulon positive regulatory protein
MVNPQAPSVLEQQPRSRMRLPITQGLPLIATHMCAPRASGALVARPRLMAHLDRLAKHRLSVLKGPAGFGKTTLLSQWQQSLLDKGCAVSWLSLDEQEDVPQRFMRYLLETLDPLLGGWSSSFSELLQSRAEPLLHSINVRLINELQSSTQAIYLIIDDYHVISHPEIHQTLGYLLQHAPDTLHIILGSRTQPPLPLSRLSAQGQLLEVNAAELRFNLGEALSYFNDATPISLSSTDVQHLLEITEGWVTGMQIAAMSPSMSSDPQRTIADLGSGTRAVSRYMREIVFDSLPPAIHEFLLRTSILNRLHPDLCDAINTDSNGDAFLEWIEQRNLFLSALDETGEWFRYHPLFAQALRAQLQRRKDIDERELHQRASRWFASHNLWSEAVRHALAAGNLENTLADLEHGAKALAETGDLDTLLRWLQQMPISTNKHRLHLQMTLAWALAHHFRFSECEALLQDLEHLTSHGSGEQQALRQAELQATRAINAVLADQPLRARTLSEPLLAILPHENPWVSGLICNVLSYCYLAEGRYQEVLDVQRHQPLAKGAEDNLFILVYRASILGQVHTRQGDLCTGERYFRSALGQAEHLTGEHSNAAIVVVGQLAEVIYERGDWQELSLQLDHRLADIDRSATLDALLRVYRSRVRCALHKGQNSIAEQLLEQGLRIAVQRKWPRLQAGLLVEQLRIRLLQNNREAAWAISARLDALSAQRDDPHDAAQAEILDYAHQAQAALLLDEGHFIRAAKAYDTLANSLQLRGQHYVALAPQVLAACAYWHAGDHANGYRLLRPLLAMAQHQQLLYSLLDAGPSLLPVLLGLQQEPQGDAELRQCLDRLLSHCGHTPLPAALGCVLSEREQQALRLIAEGQPNKQIAREMDISLETVKWHLKNLYIKLQVSSRTQALNRAHELQLL